LTVFRFSLIALLCLLPLAAHAEAAVAITDIRENQRIEGTVNDSNANPEDHCVVVYVHTDIWYIHPYAAGGRDQSWAPISGMKWSIATVKREFTANQVAAVLLKKDRSGDCPAPAKLATLDGIARQVGAPFVKSLSEGDAWFKRL
jgi:hypothetical protein